MSRNHPEVDEGWVCDKGRFAYGHLDDEDRIAEPLRRVRRRGFEPITLEEAAQEAARALREAGTSIAVAFSGTETVEEAEALALTVTDLTNPIEWTYSATVEDNTTDVHSLGEDTPPEEMDDQRGGHQDHQNAADQS